MLEDGAFCIGLQDKKGNSWSEMVSVADWENEPKTETIDKVFVGKITYNVLDATEIEDNFIVIDGVSYQVRYGVPLPNNTLLLDTVNAGVKVLTAKHHHYINTRIITVPSTDRMDNGKRFLISKNKADDIVERMN